MNEAEIPDRIKLKLREVAAIILEVLGTAENARRWADVPIHSLGNRSANDIFAAQDEEALDALLAHIRTYKDPAVFT